MQKILFLADLHGNMPATLALEEEVWISGINFRIFHGRPVHKNFHSWLPTSELLGVLQIKMAKSLAVLFVPTVMWLMFANLTKVMP